MRTIKNSGIIILLGLLFWECGNQNVAEQVIRKVKLETVRQADTIEVRTFPGRVRETAELNLAFRVAGPIVSFEVKEGDYVRSGQLIAQMDKRDYEIQLNAAQAKYEQVKAEAERVIELYNRQSVAVNDYDKAVSGLRMVEANLELAKQQLNDTRLIAPESGYIQRVNFKRNELVDAGMPVATLLDVSRYQVEVDIPVSIYTSRNNIISFSAFQPVLGDAPLDLKLLGINRKASHNQLYRLNLAVDNTDYMDLAPGMDVQVNILLSNDKDLLVCVPLTSLFHKEGNSFVWVYNPSSQTVGSREVTTGKLTGDGRVHIITGMQPGEQVVVAGVSLIGENDKVEPIDQVAGTNVGGLL